MDGGRGERGIERESVLGGINQERRGGEGGKESLPVSHQEGRRKKAVQQHSLESYPHPYFEHAPTNHARFHRNSKKCFANLIFYLPARECSSRRSVQHRVGWSSPHSAPSRAALNDTGDSYPSVGETVRGIN